MRRPLALALSLLLATSAAAVDVAGVRITDKATVSGAELVLNGAGLRTKIVFNVYVASLYVPAKASTVDGVIKADKRRVELHMLRTLDAKTLVEAMEEGLTAKNSGAELDAVKAEHDKLVATMNALGELKEHDVIDFDFADGTTTLVKNGKVKGSFAGAAFNVAILKIWLGNKPVQDDLKKHLLGA